MKLKNNIQSIQWDLLTLKRKINSIIRNLPDNPNIKRVNNSPNCFIIKFSEIVKDKNHNFSPCYYDFKYQYKAIIKKLKQINPLEIHGFLTKIVKDKNFRVYIGKNMHKQDCYETIYLHEEVIKNIQNII